MHLWSRGKIICAIVYMDAQLQTLQNSDENTSGPTVRLVGRLSKAVHVSG